MRYDSNNEFEPNQYNNNQNETQKEYQYRPGYEPYSRRYTYDRPSGSNEHSAPGQANKRDKQKNRLGMVALLLAVSLFSGMAGGGLSFLLLNQNETSVEASNSAESIQLPEASPSVQDGATGASTDISTIAAKASASVVEITVEYASFNPFQGEASTTGSGSGVVVSDHGYIVTNNHVVEGDGEITVRTYIGEEYSATLIGKDSETDLAVIKIEASGLEPVIFANSDDVAVGELAVAIGNSLGTLGGTVTSGIISAKDREITIDNQTMTLLQTSAAVNPGNSGGGLFNASGNLIGIVNAKSSGTEVEGLGFAIPSNIAKEVADEIIENGYVTGRPELGITIIEIADQQSAMMYRLDSLGVYIYSVNKSNGLHAGDRIVSVNGNEIEDSEQLVAIIDKIAVGDVLQFTVERGGEVASIDVIVGEQVPEYVQERMNEGSKL